MNQQNQTAVPCLVTLTPPISNAEKTGCSLDFLRESLLVEREAVEEEKGKQNFKVLRLLLLWRNSESVACTEEIIIPTQMTESYNIALNFCQKLNEARWTIWLINIFKRGNFTLQIFLLAMLSVLQLAIASNYRIAVSYARLRHNSIVRLLDRL